MNEPTRKPFLTAGWYNLLLFNYAVPSKVLQPHLPAGCELDLHDGSPYVSLVAFQFHHTKVFNVSWPGFTHFAEVNLRFYVRRQGQRGVCFIREFVPSRWVSAMARWLYNEPYQQAHIQDALTTTPEHRTAEYTLRRGKASMRCFARAHNQPHTPESSSLEHHFKEHELGVGRDRRGNTLTYRVHHPAWRVFPVIGSRVEVDAEALYGKDFAFLSTATPQSVVFAEGSAIQVFPKD